MHCDAASLMQMPLFKKAAQHVDTAHRKLSRLFSVVWYDLSWRFAPPGTFRQRFEQAIVNMPQGICLYDAQDRLQLVNEQFCRIYGQPMASLHMGMRFYDILANSCAVGNYPGRTVEDIYRERKAHIDSRQPGTFLQELGDGRLIAIYHQPLEDGGWVCTYEDITERRRAEARIEFLAQHDVLTELPNRLLFNERLDEILATAREDSPSALLCLDLDGFKEINDDLGHAAGDLLLKEVGRRLLANLRKGDTAARLGGDEFAILLHSASASEAVATAHRVTVALNGKYELDQYGEANVGVSIGIACAPAHANEPEALLSHADKALYAAKSAGLGIPRLYDDHLKSETAPSRSPLGKKRRESSGLQALRQAANLANDLRAAMHAGHLYLNYQPIYDTCTRRLIACEALLRWNDPVRGNVSPLEFIPIAEDSGLIGPLTEWVLLHACKEAAAWPDPVQLSVNLSPLNLGQPSLVTTVTRVLSDTGLAPQRLILELTEGLLLERSNIVRSALLGLKDLGVELWIDDFGAGHANLSYLQRLTCNVVKIDRGFLDQHDKRRELLGGMISLAQSCGLRVLAEGVETSEHDALLKELGCDLLQGYLLARPMSAESLRTLISTSDFSVSESPSLALI
jgi:diguanylate cyclase (GGDEF)-like protein/PAS domain S-box-containing protein